MTAGSGTRKPASGRLPRCRTALAVLVLIFGPATGRVTQHLGRGILAGHQVTFSHSGVRPPSRLTVSAPVAFGTPESAQVVPPAQDAVNQPSRKDASVSLFKLPPDALRGPPVAIL
jgi:hypothetical protein